jgi:hypothetical protein
MPLEPEDIAAIKALIQESTSTLLPSVLESIKPHLQAPKSEEEVESKRASAGAKALSEVEALKAQLQAERQKSREIGVKSSIRQALVDAGVPPAALPVAEVWFSSHITADDEGNAVHQRQNQWGQPEIIPAQQYIRDALKSPEGQVFMPQRGQTQNLPPRTIPSAGGASTSSLDALAKEASSLFGRRI